MHDTSLKTTGSLASKSSGMSTREFTLFSQFIENTCGIRLSEAKKFMLESRLQKRLRYLDLGSYREYYDYLVSKQGLRDELVSMIDVVTTNKTDFFREAAHFSYLTEAVLPGIPEVEILNGVRIWSAGCSSGEEPYTLAMVLTEHARTCQGFRFSILATDICTDVLESARLGIYEEEKTIRSSENLNLNVLSVDSIPVEQPHHGGDGRIDITVGLSRNELIRQYCMTDGAHGAFRVVHGYGDA
jgi:chemotaxis protein methyltransferase CheR